MIVEYFGIPGGGKTYQANLYKKQLKEKGKSYLDISRNKDMPLWLKVLYKIADKLIYVLPIYRKKISRYKELCKECHKDLSRLGSRIHNIVLFSFVYDIVKLHKRTFINDEGQLHWVLSLCANNGCSVDGALSIVLSEKYPIVYKCVKTTVGKAICNIKQRNRHVCYVDEMDEDTLFAYLSTFDKTCNEIIKQIDVEVIDTKNHEGNINSRSL